jgi:alkanesulfonate monooxygenase SsuD/methylene tetrahydromethanopterin reductase-like flavin-dependent oxidoreductase (luciferase family)
MLATLFDLQSEMRLAKTATKNDSQVKYFLSTRRLMKFAVVASNAGEYADPHLLVQLAREAELAGWDGFFIWDMLYSDGEPLVDTFVALSAIAVSTERIKLGTMALGLGRRRPWKIAREAVTLDMLSNGRLILAVGAGHPSDKALEWKGEIHKLKERLERLDECLSILHGLWTDKSFSFSGTHFSVENATFYPQPVRGYIPIWVVTTRGLEHFGPLRRAARVDGIVGGTTPSEVKQMLEVIQGERTRETPFDVVIRYDLANPTPTSAETIAIWETAGATWCRCELAISFDHLNEAREFVRAGPPKSPR